MTFSSPDHSITGSEKKASPQSATITIRFTTPAFLGGADGSSEIRTPPIKALLRRCWRLAAASSYQYDFQMLREAEGNLFGHAWLKNNGKAWAMKSPITIGVYQKNTKYLTTWGRDPKTKHVEVERVADRMIGSHLYLGYGPLIPKGKTDLKTPPALDAGTELEIRFSGCGIGQLASQLQQILTVMHWVESLGGRSRNGWGSFIISSVKGCEFKPSKPSDDLSSMSQPLGQCLARCWPAAIGKDNKGLLSWTTKNTFSSWDLVMQELARLKIGLRTQFNFQGQNLQRRHVIAYAVTNHYIGQNRYDDKWKDQRLTNQLRLKTVQEANGFKGCIVHVPAGIPDHIIRLLSREDQNKVKQYETEVWPLIHQYLDREATRW